MTLSKILTVNKDADLRNLGTLAYKIKCKRQKTAEEERNEIGRIRTRLCAGSIGYKMRKK
jgi:hypothetical protein